MPALCFGCGLAQTCMAACHDFGGLVAARFFLRLFEAGCLPLFSIITSKWFRRAERPICVAAWYSTNGLATISASALSFGRGKIPSSVLESWQIIFLFVGFVTIVSAPFVYWKLDNDIPAARFLPDDDQSKVIERLRANQTGTGSREYMVACAGARSRHQNVPVRSHCPSRLIIHKGQESATRPSLI
ncbi:hypothetical protein DOTSEDRAFT_73202 [Dothistroma septosporum NZE10]|uniref:Major facilitator superfamily (MFS) profile domain-containing protein n=1 Tax=Dothistroma septosporum (strain NZE10 / CBS 128990) TaxID=675120 RepID=N1PI54_DOTSN|nr:hypothetical protein DOTSEDRAFT_73202 [Dothistroma septosporum NZE10]